MRTVVYLHWWAIMIMVVVGESPYIYGQQENVTDPLNPPLGELLLTPDILSKDSDSLFIPLPLIPEEVPPVSFKPVSPEPTSSPILAAVQSKKVIKVRDTPPTYTLPEDSIPTLKDRDIENNLAFLDQPIDFTLNNDKSTIELIRFYTEDKLYRQQVSDMLGRGKVYFPIIDDILQQYDLPKELRYLPAALSALRPTYQAQKTHGVGLWQLPYRLGKNYGLQKDNYVDERKDVWLSTHVAAQVLKDLYTKYNDWHVTIAAFTSGIGIMNKTIAYAYPHLNGREKIRYNRIVKYLPEEYQLNVPLFIAVTYAMEYHEQHNIRVNNLELPISFGDTDTVTVDIPVTIKNMLRHVEIPEELFYFLNPSIKKSAPQLPAKKGKKYTLTIPNDKAQELVLFIQSKKRRNSVRSSFVGIRASERVNKLKYLLNQKNNQNTSFEFDNTYEYVPINPKNIGVSLIIHAVRPDEDLKNIATIYNCTIKQLIEWNPKMLSQKNPSVSFGQNLNIYVPTQFEKLYKSVVAQYKEQLVEKMDGEQPITKAKTNTAIKGQTNVEPQQLNQNKNQQPDSQTIPTENRKIQKNQSSPNRITPSPAPTKSIEEGRRKKKRTKRSRRVNLEPNLDLDAEHEEGELKASQEKEPLQVVEREVMETPTGRREPIILKGGLPENVKYDEETQLTGIPIKIDAKYIQVKEHIVKEDEDLEVISKMYGVSIRNITYVNDLPTTYVDIGQPLIIPTRVYDAPRDYETPKR